MGFQADAKNAPRQIIRLGAKFLPSPIKKAAHWKPIPVTRLTWPVTVHAIMFLMAAWETWGRFYESVSAVIYGKNPNDIKVWVWDHGLLRFQNTLKTNYNSQMNLYPLFLEENLSKIWGETIGGKSIWPKFIKSVPCHRRRSVRRPADCPRSPERGSRTVPRVDLMNQFCINKNKFVH
jgi:hypothetical protein